MFITSWTIDIRVNIQIWLLYGRYKSEWYNFWWATIQDIAACACKVWTLFGQACGQEECSQTTTTTTTTTTMTTTTTTTTDKSGLHRLATDILSWANKKHQSLRHKVNTSVVYYENIAPDSVCFLCKVLLVHTDIQGSAVWCIIKSTVCLFCLCKMLMSQTKSFWRYYKLITVFFKIV